MHGKHQYQLAPHVAACVSGSYGVILDLKRGRYLGIGPIEHSRLAALVIDWPKIDPPSRNGGATDEADIQDSIREMLLHGVIVEARDHATRVAPALIPTPEAALVEGYVRSPVRVTAIDFLYFVIAVVSARIQLRFVPLQRIVDSKRVRAARFIRRNDLSDARTRVLIFRKLAPFLFTGKSACLLDSLALSEFLRFYRHTPQLIIGVKVTPFFTAHAWLQDGDVVFNDDPMNVVGYSPILSV